MSSSIKIQAKNLGIVKNADIEFISGLNIIIGESGTGKSTILRGIEGAIFNSLGDESITQGKNKSEISITYNNHKVTRIRDKKGSFKTSYIIDGDTLTKVGSTPVPQVLSCFGIKEIKANGSSIRPNFLSQFSAPFLINEQPSKIFEYLTITSKALNLKDVELSITEDLSEKKQEKKVKEEVITSLKKIILEAQKPLEYEDIANSLCAKLQIINTKKTRIDELQKIIDSLEQKTSTLSNIEYNSVILENKLNAIKKSSLNTDSIHVMINNIEQLDNIIKSHETISLKMNRANELISKFSKLESINNIDMTKEIEKTKTLETIIDGYNNVCKNIDVIKHQGKLEESNLNTIASEIESFRVKNIPTIVISTAETLEAQLNITRKETIEIISA